MLALARLLRSSQSQHHHGTHGHQHRSSSVIAALLRMRAQYQRLGGSGNSSSGGQQRGRPWTPPPSSPSSSSAAVDALTSIPSASPADSLSVEARRLLGSEVRRDDPLSDLPATAAGYGAEVGKLLSVAAVFGSSTAAGRVLEALRWVAAHKEQLKSTRQIMSVCMPVMNLADGPTKGRSFVMKHLYPQLLASLEAAPTVPDEQQRAAVLSVFQLVSRLADSIVGVPSDADAEEVARLREQTLTLLEAATTHLVRGYHLSAGANAPAATLGLSDCAQCLSAFEKVLGAATGDSPFRSARAEEALAELCPLVDASVSPHGLTATAHARRSQDVVHCLNAALQLTGTLAAGGSSGSSCAVTVATAQGLERLAVALLGLMPSCVSASSPRDICSIVQVVNRTRSAAHNRFSPGSSSNSNGGGRVPAAADAVLPPLLEALRPQLFSVAQHQNLQLRQMECSQLVSGLSRWEGAPVTAAAAAVDGSGARQASYRRAHGGSLCVPDDLLGLLCDQFTRKMPYVLPGHLVPFLQGLARIESARHQRSGRAASPSSAGGGGDASSDDAAPGILSSRVPGVAAAVDACTAKSQQLFREGHQAVHDTARVVAALAQLRSQEALALFAAAQDQLASVLEPGKYWAAAQSDGGDHHQQQQHRQASAAVLQALDGLLRQSVAVTPEDRVVLDRAGHLRQRVLVEVVGTVRSVRSSKELVVLFAALRPTRRAAAGVGASGAAAATVGEGAADDDDDHDQNDESESVTTAAAAVGGDAPGALDFPLEAFLAKARELAPLCSAYEVATLSLAVSQLCRRGADSGSATATGATADAMGALVLRAGQVADDMSMGELKRFMDAARMGEYHCSTAGEGAALLAIVTAMAGQLGKSANDAHGGGGASPGDVAGTLRGAVRYCRSITAFTGHEVVRSAGIGQRELAAAEADLLRGFARWVTPSVVRTAPVLRDAFDTAAGASGASSAAVAPLIEQLVVLAYTASQLSSNILEQALKPRTSSEETHAIPDGEGEGVLPLGAEDGGSSGQSSDSAAALRQAAVSELFEAIAEAILAAVESSRDAYSHTTDAPLAEDGHVHLTSVLTAKQLVMLVQSFEAAQTSGRDDGASHGGGGSGGGSTHGRLLMSLLPELRTLAAGMEPLEVSLLMNSLARLGVWNGRVMNRLAAEATAEVRSRCDLRQCCSILRGAERSGFLPAGAFLWPLRSIRRDDWNRSTAVSAEADEDPLLALSRAAIDRLDSFVAAKTSLKAALEAHTVEDLVAVVRLLSYFAVPPQPTFDTYYVLALKKTVMAVEGMRASGEHVTAAVSRQDLSRLVQSVVMLASRVHHLRRADHQRVSSRTLATTLHTLAAMPFPSPRTNLSEVFRLMPAGKTAEFHQVARTHLLLYGTDMQKPLLRFTGGDGAEDILALCVSAFGDRLAASSAALQLGPLQQFWRVLAPLPVRPVSARTPDALLTCNAAEHLVSYVQSATVGATSMGTYEAAVLCDSLARCLASGACEGSGFIAATLREQLRRLLLLAAGRVETSTAVTGGATLHPVQAAQLLLASSLGVCQDDGDDAATAGLQLGLMSSLRSRPLPPGSAVDTILACAVLAPPMDSIGADGEEAEPLLSEEAAAVLLHAVKGLAPRLGRHDASSHWDTPQVYRLLLSYDGALIRLCVCAGAGGGSGSLDLAAGPLWDLLLRALVTLARAESIAVVEKHRVAAAVLCRPVRQLAKGSPQAAEVVQLAKDILRQR